MTDTVKMVTDTCPRGIIAIDGRCGSGKTTFAENLSKLSGAPVIHTDDFFLPGEMRTGERLDEPGGNFHRERFLDEVLIPLRNTGTCRYRPYDCSKGDLGDDIVVSESALYIVEGSYSCHPELWDLYDFHVFMTVSPEEQKQRIISREGEGKWEVFRTKWIPMEERYFGTYSIRERCGIVIE